MAARLDSNSVPCRGIVTVGASAGGVEALTRLIRELPADLPAALFVVLHIPPTAPSMLPLILNRHSRLRAHHAKDGELIEAGMVYVAPPDRHLLVKRGHVRLSRGPRENGSRPSVDPLFRSAAISYGPRVIGVVLSGNLGDGTAGLAAIKARGGIAVVQDPEDAIYPGMPRSAVEHVDVDHVVPLAELPELLVRLVSEEAPVTAEAAMSGHEDEDMEFEERTTELDPGAIHSLPRPGVPSGFACPDCGGALFTLVDDDTLHFRCRVGHAWSPDGLLAEQAETLESALWTALRALEESAALSTQLADRMRRRGQTAAVARFQTRASAAQRQAELIRGVLAAGKLSRGTPDQTDADEGSAALTLGGKGDISA
jgi:two-component system, chemotaxis family, protein-glutamate methylesterase/glutaminase